MNDENLPQSITLKNRLLQIQQERAKVQNRIRERLHNLSVRINLETENFVDRCNKELDYFQGESNNIENDILRELEMMDTMTKTLLETNSSFTEFNKIVSEFFRFNNIENMNLSYQRNENAVSQSQNYNTNFSNVPMTKEVHQEDPKASLSSESFAFSGFSSKMFENM